MQGQRAGCRPRTRRAAGTGSAISCRELDGNHLMLPPRPSVIAGSPVGAGVSLGADGTVGLPIDRELVAVEALLVAGLPAKVAAGGADHVDAKTPPASGQPLGIAGAP